MDLKSRDILLKIGEGSAVEIVIKKVTPLDFTKRQALPSIRHVISRKYTIIAGFDPKLQDKDIKARNQVANELWYNWIYMNVPPVVLKNIKKKLDELFKNVTKLVKTSSSKRGQTWFTEMEALRLSLDNGFDIRSFHTSSIEILTKEYGIDITEEEEKLYVDNCVPEGDGKCKRKVSVSGVDPVWARKAVKRQEQLEKLEEYAVRRTLRIETEKKALAEEKAKNEELLGTVDTEAFAASFDDDNSNEFTPAAYLKPSKVVRTSSATVPRSTRSSSCNQSDNSGKNLRAFPDIPVRSGYRKLDMEIVEVMVDMECIFKVDQRQVAPCLAYIMNKLAGQKWEVENEEVGIEGVEDCDDDYHGAESDDNSNVKRKRSQSRDLTFVLPTRKCLRQRLEDASLMSFKYVAESIRETHEKGGTVTFGTDDTVKASGHRVHDCKTGRVTCVVDRAQPDGTTKKVRQSFTTGFTANISHSGEHSAVSVRSVIGQMAVLCNVQYEEMHDFLDFFITDRAGDADVMLDSLGVSEWQRLKCNAHPLLAIQNAIDSTFKDQETEIGSQKLISTDASHVFSSPKNSIWLLGLIAFAKFLSPSHAQESVSQYKQYKEFLKQDSDDDNSNTQQISSELLKTGFNKFSSNRFGRVLELSDIFVANKEMIEKFYDEQVDQHANKLFLACFAYLNSDWFKLCCDIGSKFYKSLVIPIKEAIGIDEFKNKKSEFRSWSGMKLFYSKLLDELKTVETIAKSSDSGAKHLESQAAKNIHDSVAKQLKYMKFFSAEGEPDIVVEKIDSAPLTNSGSESNFSQLDMECRRGGQTKLETMSNRHIVKGNKLFKSENWRLMTKELKSKEWEIARNSEGAKIVKEMKNEFMNKVKTAEKLAGSEKIKKKQKKNEKTLKLLEVIKTHGGPVTSKDLDILESLDDKQILSEVRYLRSTVAPNIREKRKVEGKFVNYTKLELIAQIKNVLKPENDVESDVDKLLFNSLSNKKSKDKEPNETEDEHFKVGAVALLEGPLKERKVGTAIDSGTVQLYHMTRYGLEPDDATECIKDWKVVKIIDDYDFIKRRTGVYLVCSI